MFLKDNGRNTEIDNSKKIIWFWDVAIAFILINKKFNARKLAFFCAIIIDKAGWSVVLFIVSKKIHTREKI